VATAGHATVGPVAGFDDVVGADITVVDAPAGDAVAPVGAVSLWSDVHAASTRSAAAVT
jgi:hypothetical protein